MFSTGVVRVRGGGVAGSVARREVERLPQADARPRVDTLQSPGAGNAVGDGTALVAVPQRWRRSTRQACSRSLQDTRHHRSVAVSSILTSNLLLYLT